MKTIEMFEKNKFRYAECKAIFNEEGHPTCNCYYDKDILSICVKSKEDEKE